MGVVIPIAKHLPRHLSKAWADARKPWHRDAIEMFEAGRMSVCRLRALMASDPAFARYAVVRLRADYACGND